MPLPTAEVTAALAATGLLAILTAGAWARVRSQGRELAVAREEARAATQAKARLLAHVSHEIRTPLTAIIGHAQALHDGDHDPAGTRSAARVIARNGQQLLRLVDDLLDLAKLEAGQLAPDRRATPLFGLLAELDAGLGAMAREKGLAFSIEPAFPLPAAIATDPTRLRQVLQNLVAHAVRTTPRGGVRVVVRCDREAMRLHVAVVDTSPGLAADALAAVFEERTALGLDVARRLAAALGGGVRVESAPGTGSRVEATVATGPLDDVAWVEDAASAARHAGPEAAPGAPDLLGCRVLLAEDAPDNQRLIAHLVRLTGASITVVANGQEAVEAALAGDHDLVLMDMAMPVMGGLEATTLLRQAGFGRPILALTANVLPEDLAAYGQVGCDGCVPKPVDRARFYAALAAHLARKPAAGPVPADDVGFMRALGEDFLNGLPDALGAMAGAIVREEWEAVRAGAHALRGTAGSVGFPALAAAAGALEDAVRANETAKAARAFADLRDAAEGARWEAARQHQT